VTENEAPSQADDVEPPRLSPEEIEAGLKSMLADCEREREHLLKMLVGFLSRTGRPQAALPYVQRLLAGAGGPDERAGFLLSLGQLMEQVDDLDAAVRYYTQGLALEAGPEPVRYLLHNNLGFCLNQFRKYAEAEPLCRAAIAIDPERYNAHKNLGVALQGQGDYPSAAESLVRSARANPADPRALHHLEALLAEHPEVAAELPDLQMPLEECQALAGPARWVQ
jgi:tetratricopeptide (TPR) repeat protein